MPDTSTHPADQQLLQDIHRNHPELLAHPGDFLPLTIRVYDTLTGDRLGITLHQAPELLSPWLAYLNLTDTDLVEQQVIEDIWTRTAVTTWHGTRTCLTSYELRR